jgi:hypothetical protein
MKAASRSGPNDDSNPDTDIVVRCSNVQRNIFNEATCRISYHEDACTSVPQPDPNDLYRSNMHDPGDRVDELWKYLPSYAGPDHGGVVGEYDGRLLEHNHQILTRPSYFLVCGSENEVAPIPAEDDHFDVTNRKVEPGPIDYEGQKTTVWIEVVMSAKDQLCQRLAFGLSKIFATSTTMNADSFNSGSCFLVLQIDRARSIDLTYLLLSSPFVMSQRRISMYTTTSSRCASQHTKMS